jgi:hypothetical protein
MPHAVVDSSPMSAKQLGCCALLRVLLASALGATDLSGVCLDGFQL